MSSDKKKAARDKDPREIVTLSDSELIADSHRIIRDVSASYGKLWRMSIPPEPNLDSDFVLSELADRYENSLSEIDTLREALKEAAEWMSIDKLIDTNSTILLKNDDGDITTGVMWRNDEDDLVLEPDNRDIRPYFTHWKPIDSPKAMKILNKE